jgi:hypothetical protein
MAMPFRFIVRLHICLGVFLPLHRDDHMLFLFAEKKPLLKTCTCGGIWCRRPAAERAQIRRAATRTGPNSRTEQNRTRPPRHERRHLAQTVETTAELGYSTGIRPDIDIVDLIVNKHHARYTRESRAVPPLSPLSLSSAIFSRLGCQWGAARRSDLRRTPAARGGQQPGGFTPAVAAEACLTETGAGPDWTPAD